MPQAFENPAVKAAFDAFADENKENLLAMREMIFDVAAQTFGVGPLHETLKWGQPAYLTPETKSGTTIRLGQTKAGGAAVLTHCQTTVVSDFRALFAQDFQYDGGRALHLSAGTDPSDLRLREFVRMALTYHQT